MAFLRTPNAAPLPGDVRLLNGELQRFDVGGWSTARLAFRGQWSDWRPYASGDICTDVHDVPGLWICTDGAADLWSLIALGREGWTP